MRIARNLPQAEPDRKKPDKKPYKIKQRSENYKHDQISLCLLKLVRLFVRMLIVSQFGGFESFYEARHEFANELCMKYHLSEEPAYKNFGANERSSLSQQVMRLLREKRSTITEIVAI